MAYSYTYVFDVELFAENLTGKIYPMSVERGTKSCDYHRSNLPIQSLRCLFSQKDAVLIKKMKKDLKAKLTIRRKTYESSNNANEKSTIPEDKVVNKPTSEDILMDGIFVAYINDEDLHGAFSEDALEDVQDDTDSKGMVSGGQTTVPVAISIGFYHKGMKESMKQMYNFVTTSDMATILMFMANEAEVSGIVIDPPDNKQTYTEIICPPANWITVLRRLQITHGFYVTGMTVFHDLDTLFILDQFAPTHEYAKNDSPKVIFEITNVGSIIAVSQASIDTENGVPRYKFGAVIADRDDSALRGEFVGNALLFSNLTLATTNMAFDKNELPQGQGTGGIEIDSFIAPHSEAGKTIVVDYDELNSPFALTTLLRQMSGGTELDLKIDACDITSFLPNKQYEIRVMGDDKKNETYRGNYNISAVEFEFTKISPDVNEMTATAIARIFKTVK